MKQPQQPTGQSGEAAKPEGRLIVKRRGQYVDVSDLQRLLKLGLSLHLKGEPIKRLTKAVDSLARMTNAQAWVAAVIVVQTRATPKFSAMLRGGTDTHAAELAAARLQSELTQRGSAISSFVRSPRRIPGRILAEIDDGHRAVFAILPPERGKREQNRLTWISIHRSPERAPFIERERRLLELFHSQSAFALLRCADA